MKQRFVQKFSPVIFIIFLAGLCFLYQYDKIFTYRPVSVHQHRQCDCLSFAYNYYKCNNNFFEPGINYLSGKSFEGRAAAEFPVLQYLVAQLWNVFGYHEWIYRFLVFFIMFSGLLALFFVFRYILNDTFWQILLPLWLFSSPILIYYGNNFLADVPALSLTFIGWYFFIRYLKKPASISLVLVFLFFCLAMLLKITAGISFLALTGLFVSERLKFFKNNEKPLFQRPWIALSLILSVCAIVFSWYLYAVLYNKANTRPDEYQIFLTGILPVWDLSYEEIIRILRIIFDYQAGNYFNKLGLFSVFTFFIIVLVNYKKTNRRLLLINVIIFISCIGGILLWFRVFDDHDYYLVNYLIFIPASCLTFFEYLQSKHPQWLQSLRMKIPILGIALISIYWGYAKIDGRYAAADKQEYQYSSLLSTHEVEYLRYSHWIYPMQRKAFETITPYLRSIGITEKDLVFSFPDPSPNITLYLMGQRGISIQQDNGTGLLKTLDYYKILGIKYFILGDTSLLHDETIKKLLSKKIGAYQTVSVYDISGIAVYNEYAACDAEVPDDKSEFFEGKAGSNMQFGNAYLRTDKKSHGGKYSVGLDATNQFGFTAKLPVVTAGEVIRISVWRYSDYENTNAGICVSAENPDDFYAFNSKPGNNGADGWQQISIEIKPPDTMQGKELSVYVFNPDKKGNVYFDDLEISMMKASR
ncbi:MAG TPA: glycosyltransferase family 39 protein [Bacteroidales bacterium]|nr:glycosyltransferase family 39 protein [Bacteroidales bacterium]